MCGIFGIVYFGEGKLTTMQLTALRKLTNELMLAAELRGRNASGIAVLSGKEILVHKAPLCASELLKTNGYKNALWKMDENFRALIGHARAQTKGTYKNNHNNHPIIAGNVVGVHNGMIHNDDSLFIRYADKITRRAQVDSEIIFRLLNYHLANSESTLVRSVQAVSEDLSGSYACAFLDSKRTKFVTIFKHWNPIDIIVIPAAHLIVFASVGYTTKKAIGATTYAMFSLEERHMPEDTGARISIETGDIEFFPLKCTKSVFPIRHSVGAALLPAPTTATESDPEDPAEPPGTPGLSEYGLLRFMRRLWRD